LGDSYGETLLDKLLPQSGGDLALHDSVKKKGYGARKKKNLEEKKKEI
jgi:hypothetical protein